MPHPQRGARSSRGSALIYSVVAVSVVAVLAASFMQLALAVTRRLSSSADTLQALNLAEAGLAEAYTGLAAARSGNLGSPSAPAVFGGGLLWVEATRHGSGLVELECTAMYGTGRATLGLVCEPVETRVTALGLFTSEDLVLGKDSRLDSYDSSQGSYAEQVNTPLNARGVAGSNGDVTVAPGDLIFGDIVHGPTGAAHVASGAAVTGGVVARPETESLPPIEVPPIQLAPKKKHTSGIPLVVPPGEAGYASLEVGRNARLILEGPLRIVIGTLTLGNGAELVFDTDDGPVELYLTEALAQSSSARVTTTTQVPAHTLVFVTAPAENKVEFAATSQFHGFLYAPESTLRIAAQFEVFGGVVCRELELAEHGRLHYDLALGASLEARLPLMRSWRVIELPQQGAARRTDPFRLLGLDPDALSMPSAAHEEQTLELRYLASDGSARSYAGPESAFDWGLVDQLLYGLRDGVAFFLPSDSPPKVRTTDPLLDIVGSSLSSKDLRDALLAAGSLQEEILVAAAERVPPMAKSDLRNVLDANQPLPLEALLASIRSAALDSGALKNVLIDNSPLPLDALSAVLTRTPPLAPSDLLNVLANQ